MDGKLIYICSLMPRSGTNFLATLLAKHPDCVQSPNGIWEDYLLRSAASLKEYTERTAQNWNPKWNGSEADLLENIGGGLRSFLSSGGPKHIISKTPFADGLEHFGALFPSSRPILILRDPRDLIESGCKSFAWNFEKASREFAYRAQRYEQNARAINAIVIRFEELVKTPENVLKSLLDSLGLEVENYPFHSLGEHKVYGSSTEGDKLHWKGKDAAEEFDPLLRSVHWNAKKRARFNWIAGEETGRLGYDQVEAAGQWAIIKHTITDLFRL